ncbi:MAG: hypothetical protein ABFS45_03175 [Pseudomonadota bacterium]
MPAKPPIRGRLNLHILIPGLLGRLVSRAKGAKQFPRFAAIETLLARVHRTGSAACGFDAQLCALFEMQRPPEGDLPLGAIRRYAMTGDANEYHYFCADPVHLRADIQQALLLDASQLRIGIEDARILTDLFNHHFAAEGVSLAADAVDCWHLRLTGPEALRIQTLRQVRGGDVSPHFPSGDRARYWRGILNETQMLYHDAEPNRRRRANGELAINSLWLFGGGGLPRIKKATWSGVWGDDPLIAGLSRLAAIESQPQPKGLEFLLDMNLSGTHLVCLDDLAIASSYDDFPVWGREMQELQREWFEPLTAHLRAGTIRKCVLYDCAGQMFEFSGRDRWRFWRKPLPLYEYLDT